MTRPWRGSLGLLVMSATTAVALARLIEQGLRPGIIVPLVLAVIVADRAVLLVMRLSVPMVLAIAVGAALALLALLIGLDPTLVNPGSAHFADTALFGRQFSSARSALAHDGTPLPSMPWVIIVIGALGALAAAATRAIWESQHRRERNRGGHVGPLTGCIAPSFGVFVYSTLVSADHGRLPASLAYFGGVAFFVALADRAGVSLASFRSWRLPIDTVTGAALVLVVVLVAGSGLAGMRLSVFHITPQTPGSRAALLTGSALVDDLRAVEVHESNTVIFRAHSSLPTYWQLGTLTTFNGTEWVPSPGVDAALAGSGRATAAELGPTALPLPTDGQRLAADLTLDDLASRLLPAPPHTIAVSGLPGATVSSEGLLSPNISTAGTAYSVTAQLIPPAATSTQLNLRDPRLAPYLALPAEPVVVSFLAHEAVGSATTQGAQVQALVDWFRDGRFRYTLDPPATTGSNPLVQFLTVTRAGYCQQFAGAFGIMARSLGIPTRLAVGFIAGTPGPDNAYTVTGADAHVWPQVYLGPGTGWVSVEPTPPAASDTTAPAGVVEPSTPSTTTGTTLVPATSSVGGTIPSNPSGAGSSSTRSTRSRPRAVTKHATAIWPDLLIGVAIALALGGAWLLVRRRRGAADGGLPDQRVVGAWELAQRTLRRRGVTRRPAETPGEFAARLARLEGQRQRPLGAEALGQLAALVELACYTPWPCTPDQAQAARSWADAVARTTRRRS